MTALIVTTGCTRKAAETSSVTMTLPPAESVRLESATVGAQATCTLNGKWGQCDPATMADVNCYALLVEEPEQPQRICKNWQNQVVIKPSKMGGMYVPGQTITLDVNSGVSRRIALVGFRAVPASACKAMTANASIVRSQLSEPQILDEKTLDLVAGDKEVTLTPTLHPDKKISDCDWPVSSKTADVTIGTTGRSFTATVGTPSSHSISITNIGTEAASAISITMAAPFGFLGGTFPGTGGTCDETLAVGATCLLFVKYDPTAPGADTGDFIVSYHNSNAMMANGIQITGTASAAGSASLSISGASPYDFGSVPTTGGFTSADQSFTITNVGNLATTTLSGTVTGDFSFSTGSFPGGGTCGSSLASGSSCTVILKYTPSGLGVSNGTLTINYDGGATATKSLTATGSTRAMVAISSPAASTAVAGTMTVSGTCSPSGQNVTLTGGITTDTAGCAAGAWSKSVNITAADGSFTINADYADANGFAALTDSRSFVNDNAGPTSLSITGITGGDDSTVDNKLENEIYATGGWTGAIDPSGGLNYDVVIRNSSDTADVCSVQNTTSSSYSFSSCALTLGTTYKLKVTPKDVLGNPGAVASMSFTVGVAKMVSPGEGATCSLDSLGVLKCWGKNDGGMVGNNSLTSTFTPTIIDSGVAYKQVSVGKVHACGVTWAGAVNCWGTNSMTQLGDNTSTQRLVPTPISDATTYRDVQVGNFSSCGLTTSGVVKCWGYNGYGQLGDGTTNASPVPVSVVGGHTFKKISVGAFHVCAIKTTDELYCWGANPQYELGDGTNTDRSSPTLIDSGTTYSAITASKGEHTCGVTKINSDLKCWGTNNFGQLGTNDYAQHTTPTLADNTYDYVSVASGGDHTCATIAGGALRCWGRDNFGQLGNQVVGDILVPTPTHVGYSYATLAAGISTTCGTTSSGDYFCWGLNDYGQVGTGIPDFFTAPQIVGLNYISVSVGSKHSCGVTVNNDLKCWGLNDTLSLGNASLKREFNPVGIDGGNDYLSVSAGLSHTCAITTANKLRCWGSNNQDKVGNASSIDVSSPVDIDNASDYAQVSVGEYHTCARKTDDYIKCWGYNGNYQVGDGTLAVKSSPVTVGSNYAMVSVASENSCGINNSNNLYCWGEQSQSQFGTGNTTSHTSPYNVLSGYTQVSTGYRHTCAITTAGALHCFGQNLYGELGDGTQAASSTPVTIDSGQNYIKVAAGINHTCGITNAGVLKCWGKNTYGQLGIGTVVDALSPTAVSGGDTYTDVSISQGADRTCAIATDQTLKCWGLNSVGQAGVATNRTDFPAQIYP